MKQKKLSKKLSINKLTVSSLTDVRGGADILTKTTCPVTQATCYQYTCAGWSQCPRYAC